MKVTPVGRRATAPGKTMAGGPRSQARTPAAALWLLCALGLAATDAGPPPTPPALPAGAACLDRFTPGVPSFVLDTEASVSNGATFLGSPAVRRGRDCVRACCTTPGCNLALVELQPARGEDAAAACFLVNCLYEQNFVCKFAPKEGFVNYLTREVYRSYRELRTQGFGGEAGVRQGVDLGRPRKGDGCGVLEEASCRKGLLRRVPLYPRPSLDEGRIHSKQDRLGEGGGVTSRSPDSLPNGGCF